jgi:hypothetical protein
MNSRGLRSNKYLTLDSKGKTWMGVIWVRLYEENAGLLAKIEKSDSFDMQIQIMAKTIRSFLTPEFNKSLISLYRLS